MTFFNLGYAFDDIRALLSANVMGARRLIHDDNDTGRRELSLIALFNMRLMGHLIFKFTFSMDEGRLGRYFSRLE